MSCIKNRECRAIVVNSFKCDCNSSRLILDVLRRRAGLQLGCRSWQSGQRTLGSMLHVARCRCNLNRVTAHRTATYIALGLDEIKIDMDSIKAFMKKTQEKGSTAQEEIKEIISNFFRTGKNPNPATAPDPNPATAPDPAQPSTSETSTAESSEPKSEASSVCRVCCKNLGPKDPIVICCKCNRPVCEDCVGFPVIDSSWQCCVCRNASHHPRKPRTPLDSFVLRQMRDHYGIGNKSIPIEAKAPEVKISSAFPISDLLAKRAGFERYNWIDWQPDTSPFYRLYDAREPISPHRAIVEPAQKSDARQDARPARQDANAVPGTSGMVAIRPTSLSLPAQDPTITGMVENQQITRNGKSQSPRRRRKLPKTPE